MKRKRKSMRRIVSAMLVLSMVFSSVVSSVSFADTEDSTPGVSSYEVSLSDSENGTMAFEGSAERNRLITEGEEVTVKLTPNEGYQVNEFAITDTDTGEEVERKVTTDDVFTFTMPAQNLTLSAAFVEAEGQQPNVITSFSQVETLIQDVKEGTSLEELKEQFPKQAEVTLEDGTVTMLDVDWECEDDFENSDATTFQFYVVLPEGYVIADGCERAYIGVSMENAYGIMPIYQIDPNTDANAKTIDQMLGVTGDVVSYLTSHQSDGYFLGTPYVGLYDIDYSNPSNFLHPNGDSQGSAHMNCTGFVAYVMRALGGDLNKINNVSDVRAGGFANASNWLRFVDQNNLKRYRFNSISAALASGVLQKGDVIYFEPYDWDAPGADCHIGFFWGDSSNSNRFWHSSTHPGHGNQMSEITAKVDSELYVFPIQHKGYLKLKKSSSTTSITNGNGCYTLNGAVYGVYNNAACTSEVGRLTTNANGDSNTLELSPGNYWIKEITAPTGYAVDTSPHAVTVRGSQTTTATTSDNPLCDPSTISLVKIDKDTGEKVAEGNASLAGAQFTVKYYAGYYTKDNLPASATKTWVLQTKEKSGSYIAGLADEYKVSGDSFYYYNGQITLPLGTVTIQETKAPTGYLLTGGYYKSTTEETQMDDIFLQQIKASGGAAHVQSGNTYNMAEQVIRGGVKIQKRDLETMKTAPQGDATLEGTEFEIINKSSKAVYVNGESYNNGEVVATITSGEDGIATTESNTLPYGSYTIREKTPPTGYLANNSDTYDFTITTDGTIIDLTDESHSMCDQVIRGGVKIQKRDFESKDAKAMGGASLEGAVFQIVTLSKNPVVVEGKEYTSGQVVKTIRTNEDGLVTTASNLLPYGTYRIDEVTPPTGYKNEGIISRQFEVREDGKIVDMTSEDNAIQNQIIRGDFELTKIDGEEQIPIEGIEFRITSNTTGESHTFTTDENGHYSSKSDFNPHSNNTNGGGAEDGLWFGQNEEGTNVAVNDDLGALPYDTYTLEELPGDLNAGKKMYTGTIIVTRDGYMLNLGDIENHDISITTTARDGVSATSYATPDDNVRIVDRVVYTGLTREQEYILKGTLINKKTASEVLDEDGRPITSEYSFKPETETGAVEIEFQFDATGLANSDVVVFEELWKVNEGEDNDRVAVHQDLRDENQTIHFAGIETKAVDDDTDSVLSKADNKVTIVDTVSYYNLVNNLHYTMSGTLMDKDTNRPLLDASGKPVTGQTSFTANDANGTVEVIFSFDATGLEGKTVVVYEELIREGHTLATHHDLEDESQTVYLPKIGTTAADRDTGFGVSRADESVTIIDTIAYENLIPGENYKVKGVLMDIDTKKPLVDEEGEQITSEATFRATAKNGNVRVSFNFDGRYLDEGATVVVFEELFWNDMSIAEHKDLEDENQTIMFPAIWTSVIDNKTELKMTYAESGVSLTDTVEYANLVRGQRYTVKGTLRDKETGNIVTDSDGNPITAETSFTARSEEGSVEVQFDFNAKNLAGTTLVVCEELFTKDKSIALHDDLNDKEQTFVVPAVGTKAIDKKSGINVAKSGENIVIEDTVSYKNLIPEHEYRLEGVLMDKETGEEARDSHGRTITAELTFVPEKSDGEEKMTFTFDGEDLDGSTFVVFETLYYSKTWFREVPVADHKDISDDQQSIHFPKIGTQAADSETGIALSNADGDIQIKDTVSYKNLEPGYEYTVKGTLMDKETGEPLLDDDGNEITAEGKFEPSSSKGTTEITFEFSGAKMAGKTVVAFEKLFYGEAELANHESLEDEKQTVYIPKIKTSAIDSATKDHVAMADDEITIKDTVSYENLVPGLDYTVKGELKDRSTGETLTDAKGKSVTAETTFNAEKAEGTAKVTFTFDGSGLDPKTLTVYETLYFEGHVIAEHKELTDEKQTIRLPHIGTQIIDNATEIGLSGADSTVALTDTVSFEGLLSNRNYVLRGTLVDSETGDPVKDDNGDPITGEKEFAADAETGKQTVEFSFSGKNLEGKTVVCFEDLYLVGDEGDEVIVAKHSDLKDAGQTIHFPEIGTQAMDSETKAQISMADDSITIVDTVSYHNVLPGYEYKLKGYLMDKETEEKALDDSGNEITAEAVFTPDEADGSAEVTFLFSGRKLAEKSLVAYEELYYEAELLAEHKEITDEGQTIHIPGIHTMALDSETKDHVAKADDVVTITDTISYTNLIAGETYTAEGVLKDKATGETLVDADGNEVTAEAEFEAENADGTVDVTFTFNAAGMDPSTVVVYEEVYYNNVLVAEHLELSDEDQTVRLPNVQTRILDSATELNLSHADEEITLVDTVTFENLLKGRTYILKGILMDKDTGEAVKDDNGKDVVGTTEFEAEAENGTQEVTFTFSGKALSGKTTVCYEELFVKDAEDNEVSVAEHKVLTDEKQSAHFPEIGTQAVDRETGLNVSKADGNIQIEDTVAYKNLLPGYQYQIKGVLMDKATGKAALDRFGGEVTAKASFIAEEADGTAKVTFVFDGKNLGGSTLVAYEELYYNTEIIAEHKDIDDEDQTIYLPGIKTKALDGDTKDHISKADDEVTVIDTVTYSNLFEGQEYVLRGQMVDKETGEPLMDADGQPITGETTFIAKDANGTADVALSFNGSGMDPETMIVYEQLFYQEKDVAEHKDLTDTEQQVQVPSIHTRILDSDTEMQISKADGKVKLIDTVSIENLLVDRDYILKGILVDKETGEPVQDDDGKDITGETKFTAENADDNVEVEFAFAGKSLAGRSIVCFEELLLVKDGRESSVAEHHDLADEQQSMVFPEIRTLALDSATEDHIANADQDITITDTVSYKNLIPGMQYEMKGTLMSQKTEEPVKDADGNAVTAESRFVADEADGTVVVTFNFDGSSYKGDTVVVFESCYLNGKDVADHKDISDEAQSIRLPAVKTFAHANQTDMQNGVSGKDVTLTDQVNYENVIPGQEYTVKGQLFDEETHEAIVQHPCNDYYDTLTDEDGNIYYHVKDGEAYGLDNGYYRLNSDGMYEACNADGSDIVESGNAGGQSGSGNMGSGGAGEQSGSGNTGSGGTGSQGGSGSAGSGDSGNQGGTGSAGSGKKYQSEQFREFLEECGGGPVVVEKKFVADSENGSIDVEFTFDSNGHEGRTVVIYEEVYKDDDVIIQDNIHDKDQFIHFPQIRTTASADGIHEMLSVDEAVVTDTVRYRNLIPGNKYTVKGKLMDKETGEAILVDDKEITAELTFEPDEPDGSVDLEFSFDASEMSGKTLVVFEKLFLGDVELAAHESIDDEEQTIHIPEIHTNAADGITGNHTGTVGKTTIVDVVSYKNLIPGRTYTMSGVLMDKETGKVYEPAKFEPVPEEGEEQSLLDKVKEKIENSIIGDLIDNAGEIVENVKDVVTGNEPEGIRVSTTFVPETADGEVELVYELSSEPDKTLVVFEDLSVDEKTVAVHADIDDEDQTVYYPDVHTNAVDQGTETHVTTYSETAKIVDTVTYENLIPGKEYTVKGQLMDKETGNPIENAVAEAAFTPEEPDGTVDLVYELDTTKLSGKTTVVFEDLYLGDNLLISHADIEDKAQSVYSPALHTTATVNGEHEAAAVKDVVLVDAVEYSNLVPGQEYTVKGRLMLKDTGEELMSDGKPVAAEAEFKPDEANGKVEVEFHFDASDLDGKTVVAFEDLYVKEQLTGTHSDLEDTAQSVTFHKQETPPVQTNDPILPIVGIFATALLLAMGTFLFLRRRYI